jgi:protein gp37
MAPAAWGDGWPKNVWAGTSVEDQATADLRIAFLLKTPAAIRFLSVEPMLERIDFSTSLYSGFTEPPQDDVISWVIFGGESGPGARPCEVGWIRDGLRQCKAAGVAAFVKQLGARPVIQCECGSVGGVNKPHLRSDHGGNHNGTGVLCDRKGGDPSEWPEDLRIREFPIAVSK